MSGQERIRCSTCGALAAPGDEWCGQCYARLVREPSPSGTKQAAAPQAEDPRAGHPSVPPPPMPVPPAQERVDRRMGDERRTEAVRRAPVDRRAGEDRRSPAGRPTPAALLNQLWEMPTVPEPEGLAPPMTGGTGAEAPGEPTFLDAPAKPVPTWPCAVCETQNPLARDTCMSCGAPFARLFKEEAARPQVPASKAARWSLLYPGLGHAVLGRRAEGVARAILFTWCAATAILLLSAHPAGGLGILLPMAVVFVLGSLLWYGVTALDAARLANGAHQVVTSKIMLYSVAALMMMSVGSVFLMVIKAGHLSH